MVSFLAAFAFMCLDKVEPDTRITVVICLVFTGFLIAWCIYVGWEKTEDDKSMDARTLAYYPPKSNEDEADASSYDSSPADGVISSIASLSNGQNLSQSPDAFRGSSTAESVRSRPAPSSDKSHPRFVDALIDAFRFIYVSGSVRSRRRDVIETV